jgi:Erv1 / Alr family
MGKDEEGGGDVRQKNLPPETWGAAAWTLLHATAYAFPTNPTHQEKLAYTQLFANLRYTLPCASCRINVVKELEKFPLTDAVLTNSHTLGTWLNELHNSVSVRLKKPVMTYEQRLSSVIRPATQRLGGLPSSPDVAAAHQSTQNNTGLVVWGGVIGCGALLIIMLVIVVCCRQKCLKRVV